MRDPIRLVGPDGLKDCTSYRVIDKDDLFKYLKHARGGDTFGRSSCGGYYYVPESWCKKPGKYELSCGGDPVPAYNGDVVTTDELFTDEVKSLGGDDVRTLRNDQLNKEREL